MLSYDYKNPEAGRDRALQVLTGDLKSDYADLWQKALISNVKKAKAFARSEVVNAGVACVSDDGRRVGVLVVVDATTGNVKQSDDLTISFTATMEDVDGEWLVATSTAGTPTPSRAGSPRSGVRRPASPSDGSSGPLRTPVRRVTATPPVPPIAPRADALPERVLDLGGLRGHDRRQRLARPG